MTFVYIDDYGIQGSNYYWDKRDMYNATQEELERIGLTGPRVQVHADIIEPLKQIRKTFLEAGYDLYIKEGYRSKELYEVVYQKRVEKFGKKITDQASEHE